MVLFGIGAFWLPVSIAILWQNEKRKVIYAHLTNKARKQCIEANSSKPKKDDEYSLVHISGTA